MIIRRSATDRRPPPLIAQLGPVQVLFDLRCVSAAFTPGRNRRRPRPRTGPGSERSHVVTGSRFYDICFFDQPASGVKSRALAIASKSRRDFKGGSFRDWKKRFGHGDKPLRCRQFPRCFAARRAVSRSAGAFQLGAWGGPGFGPFLIRGRTPALIVLTPGRRWVFVLNDE